MFQIHYQIVYNNNNNIYYLLHMLLVLTKNKNYVIYIWNKHKNIRGKNNTIWVFKYLYNELQILTIKTIYRCDAQCLHIYSDTKQHLILEVHAA